MSTHRVLLLTTAHSYRNEPFQRAAGRLDIEVILGIDAVQPPVRVQPGRLALDFNRVGAAASAIVEFAHTHSLDAILAADDSGVVLAAEAAGRLGLVHNSPQAAQAARDKYVMRSLMAAAGVPCPWFRTFSTADDLESVAASVPYPCVVKPLNLNASRGVMRADGRCELVAAIQRLARILDAAGVDDDTGSAHRAHPFLVEAFIPGIEVALEGILDDGELTVLALFDKPDPLDGPFFEETIYVTPSRLPDDVQAAIAASAGQAARAIGLRTGPIHAELRVNENGPWLLEVAGRSIGGLCGQTLRFEMDMSLEELILRQACGLPWRGVRRNAQATGVMMIPIPEAGILREVEGLDAAAAVPGVENVEITAARHHTLLPLPEGDSYLGFIFARGETPAAVERALRAAHKQLRFHIVPEFIIMQGPAAS
ncbi:MAG: ATP-grasp domain-containing protein [Caldilineaceae bacterium]|nr:ATP-grasp domain-containing protein [Caldilineaceae bacterium]